MSTINIVSKRIRKVPTTKKTTETKPAAAEPKTKKTAVPDGHITIVEIAKELGIDPRMARMRLRKKKNGLVKDVLSQSRWTVPMKDKATWAALISPEVREKKAAEKKTAAKKTA